MVLRWVNGDRSQLGRSRVCRIGQDESHTQRPTARSTQRVQVAMVQIAAHLRLGVGQEQQRQERFSLRAGRTWSRESGASPFTTGAILSHDMTQYLAGDGALFV